MLSNCINIKSCLVFFTFLLSVNYISGQEIFTIDQAIDLAIKKQKLNYQKKLISQKSDVQHDLIKKQKLPQINWTAQATLQSENIDLEFPVSNIPSITLPLYKANTDLEVNYVLYDGGINDKLSEQEELKKELELSVIDNQLFNVKAKVVDIYFSIITLNHQKAILDSSYQILKIKEDIINTAINNGVALKSDRNKLEIEEIKMKKNIASILSKKKTLIKVLEDLTGSELNNKRYKSPYKINFIDDWSSRPENRFFNSNINLINQGKDLIDAKNKPKVILFAKGGIGYPNPFNFFDDNIAPYAIGGVKFIWNFWDWKKSNIQKQKLEIDKSIVNNKKEVFNENVIIEKNRIKSQIQGLEENLHFDKELIKKQDELIVTIENQYRNGVATINDLLMELTKKSISEINFAMHKIEIIKLKYRLKTFLGQ